ncbi:MAG: methyltransferase domain-containing protein [Vicinamibacterales bacterium]
MSLSDLFSRRKKAEDPDADTGPSDGPVHPTKALARFLTSLGSRSQPVLLDLGPVVGQNVTFFGEQLGCKIFVENLYKDIDRHVKEGKLEALPGFFEQRFPQESASVDGILCWDVLDYLDRPAAQAVAKQLARILKPEGALLAFFQATQPTTPVRPEYTRYVVVDPSGLQYRPYAAARGKQKPLLNRDIERMFEPLRVAEQFLLKTNLREVLFRKPAARPLPPEGGSHGPQS